MPRLKTVEIEDRAVACCAPIGANALTDEEAEATARLFKALADPARIRLLNVLLSAEGPVCVCDLTLGLSLSQPTVSHHLRKLLDAGLVTREERGTWAYYSVDEDAMGRLARVADVRRRSRWPM
jgi:ArsR family transcriptional regulator